VTGYQKFMPMECSKSVSWMQHFTISPFLQMWQVHDAYTQLDGTQVPGDHRPGAQLIEMEKLVLECK
jgi:hypothetical protein